MRSGLAMPAALLAEPRCRTHRATEGGLVVEGGLEVAQLQREVQDVDVALAGRCVFATKPRARQVYAADEASKQACIIAAHPWLSWAP